MAPTQPVRRKFNTKVITVGDLVVCGNEEVQYWRGYVTKLNDITIEVQDAKYLESRQFAREDVQIHIPFEIIHKWK